MDQEFLKNIVESEYVTSQQTNRNFVSSSAGGDQFKRSSIFSKNKEQDDLTTQKFILNPIKNSDFSKDIIS